MYHLLVQPNKVNGSVLGHQSSNSFITLDAFFNSNFNTALQDQCPSAKEYYESRKNQPIGASRIEERNRELEQLEREYAEEELYLTRYRKRRKHSQQLADWLYELGIRYGRIEHGTGKCKCCTRPEIVKQNEDIWEQKWKETQRQERREKEWLRLQQLDEDDDHKGDGEAKRWYREREKYEDLKWSFY